MPSTVGCGYGTSRNHIVNMRMILKLTAPGMKYAKKARKITACKFGISGESF
jgi:hypothetical protein